MFKALYSTLLSNVLQSSLLYIELLSLLFVLLLL
jgi:hypothetical protein